MIKTSKASKINVAEVTSRLMKLILELDPEDKVVLLNDLEKKCEKNLNRNSRRLPYFEEVYFSMRDKLVQGFIINLSETGIFINSHDKPEMNDEITMTFSPPGKSSFLKVKGVVVRNGQDGFGVEFRDGLDYSILKDEIKKN